MNGMETQQELIEGLLQYVTLAEGERKLLAADLHDQTLFDLRELAQLARRLSDKLRDSPLSEVRAGLVQLTEGIEAAMDEVRRAMESLSPSALDTLGLLPAIENCLERASASCEKPFATRFSAFGREEQIPLSEIEQLLVYRIIQEAFNNIAKHAGARSVEVLIVQTGANLFIRVTDDGDGMIASGDLRRARGLENMRYRARLIGAQLTWLRATGGRGTVVEMRVPLKRY
jgi:signal transduction histidine kinase